MDLRDRSILRTGGGSGIGRAFALQLAEQVEVAAASVAGITDGSLTVIRGGEARSRMIALNQDDPGAVDQQLAGRKLELEQAVAGHSSL